MIKQMIKKYNFYIQKHFGEYASAFLKIKYAIVGLLNFIIYGSTVTDFFELTFYKKSRYEKKKYMTFRDSNKFARAFDDLDKGWTLSKKTELSSWIGKYLKRDQLNTESMCFDEFKAFCEKHPIFLFKPSTGSCGIGIEKVEIQQRPSVQALYDKYYGEDGVLDEFIVQHKELEALHPQSLNTLRIFTVRIAKEVHIAAAVLRMGNGGSVIDNYSAGGVVAPVDVKTGLVTAAAEDIYGSRFVYHPYSGKQIVGFNVPNWEKILEQVNSAAAEAPLSYVGWDIAVRENDCVIVEANYRPMINVVQTADGGGKKEQFTEYLKQQKKASSAK